MTIPKKLHYIALLFAIVHLVSPVSTQAAQISLNQLGSILAENDRKPFKINSVEYGTDINNVFKKIEKPLHAPFQKFADKGIFAIPDNEAEFLQAEKLFEDPAKGYEKELRITFEMNGQTYKVSVPQYRDNQKVKGKNTGKAPRRGTYSLPEYKGDVIVQVDVSKKSHNVSGKKLFYVTTYNKNVLNDAAINADRISIPGGIIPNPMPAESNTASIELNQIETILVNNNRKPFQITRARYGAKDKYNDCTNIMQQYADKGILLIPNDMNSIFKDPINGTKKNLEIDTLMSDASIRIIIPEHKEDRKGLSLPQNSGNTIYYLEGLNNSVLQNPNTNADTLSAAPAIEPAPAPEPEPTPAIAIGEPSPSPIAIPKPLLIGKTLQENELGDVLRENDRKPFKILNTWYGFPADDARSSQNLTSEVKEILQSLADKGIFAIPNDSFYFFGKRSIAGGSGARIYIQFQLQDTPYWHAITIGSHHGDSDVQTRYNLPSNERNNIFYVRDHNEKNMVLQNTEVNADKVTSTPTIPTPAPTLPEEVPTEDLEARVAQQVQDLLNSLKTVEQMQTELARLISERDGPTGAMIKRTAESMMFLTAAIAAIENKLREMGSTPVIPVNPSLPVLKTIQNLPLSELGKVLAENDRKPFKIHSVEYGTDINNVFKKVEKPLHAPFQRFADKGLFAIPDNEAEFLKAEKLFEDPAKGYEKELRIVFEMNGQIYTVSIPQYRDNQKIKGKNTGKAPRRGTYSLPEYKDNKIVQVDVSKKTHAVNGNKRFYVTTYNKNILSDATMNADSIKGAEAAGIEPGETIPKEEITNPDGTIDAGNIVEADKTVLPPSGIIQLADLGLILPANDQKPFKIVDAWYGVSNDPKNLRSEVIQKLQDLADKGLFVIPENMNHFFEKDPIPNVVKTLYIKFAMQDREYEIRIPEHKKDRGNYELPKKIGKKQWFVIKRAVRDIIDPERLAKLAFNDRIKNTFKILDAMNRNEAFAKNAEAVEVLFQEITKLFESADKENAEQKNELVKMIKNARSTFFLQYPQLETRVKALAEKYGFPANLADALNFLRTNGIWTDRASAQRFIQAVKNVASLNEGEKLASEETKDLMSVIQAAQIINNGPEYKEMRDELQKIFDDLKVPAAEAPEVLPDPKLTNPQPTVEKASETTYQAQLNKLIDIKVLASSTNKDDCIQQIQELVRNRAYASKDQITQLEGFISYYIHISPYFKNDEKRLKSLEKAQTDLNSGITYTSRLEAAKAYLDKATLLMDEKIEWFNILEALAHEKGKANIHEEATARAYLITAKGRYKEEADAQRLNNIETVFNAPIEEVKQPEAQVNQADKPVETALTDEEKKSAENAQNNSTQVVNDAAQAAVAGKSIEVAQNEPYGKQIMSGFAQILAAKMNPSEDATAKCLELLKRLVNNKFLGSQDDQELLKSLLQYAIGNITDEKFTTEVKALGNALGTSLDFAQQIKSFRDVIIRSDFATNVNLQKDALRYIQGVINKMPGDANNSLRMEVKSILMAAASIFPEQADKDVLLKLQESIQIKNVEDKPLQTETTKIPESEQKSIANRIDELIGMRGSESIIKHLQGIMDDRPRASQDALIFLKDTIQSYVIDNAYKPHESKLKEYIATLERPATIAEQVGELEELATFNELKPFHNLEVIRIVTDLSRKLTEIKADQLTRLKAVLLTLSAKILATHKASFNALMAIFDAPAEIIAPKATQETGEKLPEATTQAQPTSSDTAVVAGTTTSAVTLISQGALSKAIQEKGIEIADLQKQLGTLQEADPQYQEKQKQIETLQKEVSDLQVELEKQGQPEEKVTAPESSVPVITTRTVTSTRATRGTIPTRDRSGSVRIGAVRAASSETSTRSVRGANATDRTSRSVTPTRSRGASYFTDRTSRIATGGDTVEISSPSRSRSAPITRATRTSSREVPITSSRTTVIQPTSETTETADTTSRTMATRNTVPATRGRSAVLERAQSTLSSLRSARSPQTTAVAAESASTEETTTVVETPTTEVSEIPVTKEATTVVPTRETTSRTSRYSSTLNTIRDQARARAAQTPSRTQVAAPAA